MATEQKRNVQLWPRMMRVKSQTTQSETVKRPSCRVKGRIGANDNQQETRVARTAKCRQKQKAGYNQHTSPNFRHTAPILPILAKMENNGKSKYTLKNYAKLLKFLTKNTNMNSPEDIKQFIAKIEGHGNLTVDWQKDAVKLNVHEGERLFEGMLVGRPAEEMYWKTPRICGVCPVAHNLASLRAVENAYGMEISKTTMLLRRLMMDGQMIQSHMLHLYFLALPDYLGIDRATELAKKNPEAFHFWEG